MGRGVVMADFFVVAMLACLGGVAATVYVVSDSRGWTASPNITVGYYDEWAASKTFTGDDSLKFVWNGTHNVAIVSRKEYNNCTKMISMFQGGKTFSITLPTNANGPYYFISTVNSNRKNRQKLAINVVRVTPAESLNSSASSITIDALSVQVLVSSSIIAMFMN